MANRLYVDAVHLRYLRNESTENKDQYGFLVGDDGNQFQVLDFPTEADIPSDIEGFLRHISFDDHTEAWDLIVEHVMNDKGVCFDGNWIDREEVFQLIEKLKDEADE